MNARDLTTVREMFDCVAPAAANDMKKRALIALRVVLLDGGGIVDAIQVIEALPAVADQAGGERP